MDANELLVVVLAMVAIGGAFYVFAYPAMSRDVVRNQRQKALQAPKARRNDRGMDQAKRREKIAETLKDMESKNKRKRSLADKLAQAGLEITPQQFWLGSLLLGVVIGGLVFFVGQDPLISLVCVGIGALGLPQWTLSFLLKRRLKRFINEFPNAVDVIIRGVKAGLPLGDCMRIIAAEAAEPVRTEFRRIAEGAAIGMSIPESVERLHASVPLPEANFFSIVINLQSKSGGNLSEALGNLSRVLRDRKKMALKIRAMSSEAKTSAGIIGAMPFLVAFFVWLTTPDYINILFTQTTGRIVLGCCAVWMSIGIFVMRKLINFDF